MTFCICYFNNVKHKQIPPTKSSTAGYGIPLVQFEQIAIRCPEFTQTDTFLTKNYSAKSATIHRENC